MTGRKDANQKMVNLAEAMIEDLMQLSDDELLRELREDGEDVAGLSDDVAAIITAAAASHGKNLMARARANLDAARTSRGGGAVGNVLSLDEKRRVVARFAANDASLKDKLTMAARSGHALTESDLNSLLEDLYDLGAIDEGGKER
jgi:hypothetical protein